MPRPITLTGADGLPLWDTFEAIYFFGSGVFIGIVLGIFFPSLWRSLRRKFRDPLKYAPDDFASYQILPNKNLPLGDAIESDSIEGSFILARRLAEEGKEHLSIQVYIKMLGEPHISRSETNRAFFELSQVYLNIGLMDRASDLLIELLSRKPKNFFLLQKNIQVSVKTNEIGSVVKALSVFSGDLEKDQINRLVYDLSSLMERSLLEQNFKNVENLIRRLKRLPTENHLLKIQEWFLNSTLLLTESKNSIEQSIKAFSPCCLNLLKVISEVPLPYTSYIPYLDQILMNIASEISSFDNSSLSFSKLKTDINLTDFDQKIKSEFAFIFFVIWLNHNKVKNHSELEVIYKIIVHIPMVEELIASFQKLPPLVSKPLAASYQLHQCQVCSSTTISFMWYCTNCNSYESLKPSFMPDVQGWNIE